MKDARLIAERYAQALSEAVPSDADLTRIKDDVDAMSSLIADSGDLSRALGNPTVSPDAKLNIVKALAASRQAQPTTVRFLVTLAEHGRLPILGEVAAAVRRVVDARLGVVEVEVRSAVALDAGLRERLEAALARMTAKRVRLVEIVDAEILGGLVVKIGGTIYDGSVKTQLEGLRQRLAGELASAG